MTHRRVAAWAFVIAVLLVSWVRVAEVREDILEIRVRGIATDPMTETPVVVLEEVEGGRMLPIWVGVSEAQAIARELEQVKAPRPMTHDLMKAILEDMQATVERVVINDLRNNTYYAEISLSQGDARFLVDSRPSDAIALALRVQAPIFVARRVMEAAGEYEQSHQSTGDRIGRQFGFYPQDLTEALAEYFQVQGMEGVLVSNVRGYSMADRAGLRRGDVILKVEGGVVSDVEQLGSVLLPARAGAVISLDVWRGQETLSVELQSR